MIVRNPDEEPTTTNSTTKTINKFKKEEKLKVEPVEDASGVENFSSSCTQQESRRIAIFDPGSTSSNVAGGRDADRSQDAEGAGGGGSGTAELEVTSYSTAPVVLVDEKGFLRPAIQWITFGTKNEAQTRLKLNRNWMK